MRIISFLLTLFFILNLQAQKMEPKWKQGDTLRFFISQSELVGEERLGLESAEITLQVSKMNEKRSILEAHIDLLPYGRKEEHWQAFYKRLGKVNFTFFFESGSALTFSRPMQLEQSLQQLKSLKTLLLSEDHLQPIPFGEISSWLGDLETGTLPVNLQRYFQSLDPLFNQYGQIPFPQIQIPFANPIFCGDSSVLMRHLLTQENDFHTPDTFYFSRNLSLDTGNRKETFQALANCNKLEGINHPGIDIENYTFSQTESWKYLPVQGLMIEYHFEKKIEIHLRETTSTRIWLQQVRYLP